MPQESSNHEFVLMISWQLIAIASCSAVAVAIVISYNIKLKDDVHVAYFQNQQPSYKSSKKVDILERIIKKSLSSSLANQTDFTNLVIKEKNVDLMQSKFNFNNYSKNDCNNDFWIYKIQAKGYKLYNKSRVISLFNELFVLIL